MQADIDLADAYTTNSYGWSDGPLQQYVTLANRDGVTVMVWTALC